MKNYLRKFRLAANLSQEDLATRVGVTRETISRMEHQRANPSLALAYRLSATLRVAIEDIFVPEENKLLQ